MLSTLKDNYRLGVSNPCFEYWLLLHFEDGDTVHSSKSIREQLRKYLPDYDKHIDENKVRYRIKEAIFRAKQRDNPPCKDWPRKTGTTVYRLVEILI